MDVFRAPSFRVTSNAGGDTGANHALGVYTSDLDDSYVPQTALTSPGDSGYTIGAGSWQPADCPAGVVAAAASLAPSPAPIVIPAAPRCQGVIPAPVPTSVAYKIGEKVSDPVNPFNGEFLFRHVDLEFPGFGVPFKHERIYRSRVAYDGPLGFGWDHTHNQRLIDGTSCAGEKLFLTGEAYVLSFKVASQVVTSSPDGSSVTDTVYESPVWSQATLRGLEQRDVAGVVNGNPIYVISRTWTMSEPEGIVRRFDGNGLLSRIEDANAHGLTLEWEPSPRDDAWRLATVTDSVGRQIAYAYSTDGRLTSVIESVSGLQVSYVQDANGDLVAFVAKDGWMEEYEYHAGTAAVTPDYVPEGMLAPACELACAVSTDSCDAGGACDGAAEWGAAHCLSECGAGCAEGCDDRCYGHC